MSNSTLIDVVKKVKPSLISEEYDGGVEGCPQFYRFLDTYHYRLCHEFESCSDCWNQKAIKKKIREDKPKKKQFKNRYR